MDSKWLRQSTFIQLFLLIIFFASGIIINIIQGVLYYTLGKFNTYLYRKINYYLIYSLQSEIVFAADWWSESELNLYIDKKEFDKYYGKEHILTIINHSTDIDWIFGYQLSDRINNLGSCKAFVKKSLKYVPPLGVLWNFGECIFLERSYEKDKETIDKQFKELLNYPDPINFFLFPEGTRFTQKKHEESQKFAKKNGLPVLKYHLTPRTKGFTTILPTLKGNIDAIYDVNIAFEKEVAPTLINVLTGKKIKTHIYICRIPLENIPNTEEEAAKWLQERYVIKDRLQESFDKTGDFFAESGVERIESFRVPRRIYPLLNVILWGAIIYCAIFRYCLYLFVSGSIIHLSLVFGVFGIIYVLSRCFVIA